MMSSLSFRAAIAVAALAVTGAAQSQTSAPAPAPSAQQPAPQAAPQAAPQTAPQAAQQPNPQLMTPQAPTPKADSGTEAPGAAGTPAGEPPKRRRSGSGKGNFMPANPDATPVVPGQGSKSQGATAGPNAGSAAQPSGAGAQGGAQGTGAQDGGKGGGKKKSANRPIGMGRAFQDLQTKEEFTAYSAKVKAVKTYSECKALIETTKKELEPRAKAENKPMTVNATEMCDKAKARGRLKG
jgi:hypothetical protein